jgi:hypothetical protein
LVFVGDFSPKAMARLVQQPLIQNYPEVMNVGEDDESEKDYR